MNKKINFTSVLLLILLVCSGCNDKRRTDDLESISKKLNELNKE